MNTKIIEPGSETYPSGMLELRNPTFKGAHWAQPRKLYLRGSIPHAPGIAVVGARRPLAESLAFTRKLTTALAGEGYCIWSGGAVGIDCCAHEAALAAGSPTVVVLAGGLDIVYPPEHAELYQRVLESGGALLSLKRDGTAYQRSFFIERNKVLAACTGATLVMEANLRSGARSTAAAARRLGRPVLVVPHSPWSQGVGCAKELALGAQAISSPADAVSAAARARQPWLLTAPPPSPPVAAGALPSPKAAGAAQRPLIRRPLEAVEQLVLAALSDRPTHPDEICHTTGEPYRLIARTILGLTLAGLVIEGPIGLYRRHPQVSHEPSGRPG